MKEKMCERQLKKLLELSDIWRRYDQVYSEWAQKHGVSSNAMILIEEMALRPDGVEPAEVADYLGIPRQTMTTTLDGLERRGLLGRFPHETDRRRKVVLFTEAGRELAESLVSELYSWELSALATIDESERNSAFATVKKLCCELEASVNN